MLIFRVNLRFPLAQASIWRNFRPRQWEGQKMGVLVIVGALVTLVGLGILIGCIVKVARAKRAGLPDEEMRNALQSLVAWNMGALAISALGLILVVTGLVL